MSIDLESQYDTKRQSPAVLALFEQWREASQAYRTEWPGFSEDVAYGPGARDRYDYAPSTRGDTSPLVVYIHGGYWQGGDRRSYSHLARAFNARGWGVAIPSYRLCPEVTVAEIPGDLRRFVVHLAGRWPGRPMLLIGHSAGAQIAAALLQSPPLDSSGEPLVTTAVGISGIYDLAPLVTTRANDQLRLTAIAAVAVSPVHYGLPAGARMYTAVGGLESAEFQRQSLNWAASIRPDLLRPDSRPDCLVVDGVDHYTILRGLGEADHPLALLIEQAMAHAMGPNPAG